MGERQEMGDEWRHANDKYADKHVIVLWLEDDKDGGNDPDLDKNAIEHPVTDAVGRLIEPIMNGACDS